MPVSIVGNFTRHHVVDTDANINTNYGSSAIHGALYLSSGIDKNIYIGNNDGTLAKVGRHNISDHIDATISSPVSGELFTYTGSVWENKTLAEIGIEAAFDKGTIIQGSGITLTGTLTNRLVGSGNLTIDHADTSSFSKTSLTGATVISNLTVDTYGHITDWTTRSLVISDILSIPNREIVFGTGTGVISSSLFKYTTSNSVQIGTGTVTGTYSFNMGAGTNASNYTMNIGGGTVNNISNYSLIICESGSEISGSSNANLSVLIGGNNNKIIAGTDAYGNVIMGVGNTVTSTTTQTTYNRILGNDNTITDAYYCNILGGSNSISSSGAYSAYYNDIIGYSNSISGTTSNAYHNKIIGANNTISNGGYNNLIGRYCNNGGYSGVMLLSDGGSSTLTATANYQFSARFYGGYRFMQNGSTQWMAIAPTTGYVTINNIPDASSATDILVSNSNVISKRTLSSLNIPAAQIQSDIAQTNNTALDYIKNADDLKAIEALSGTSGLLKKTGANTWTLDTNTYLTSLLWSDSSGIIEPLSNSWIQLKPITGNGNVRLLSDTDSGIIEIYNDDSSQTLIIKSDTNDDVNYLAATGKTHKFTEKLSVSNLPTSSSTSYLTENSGVLEKRGLHYATSSVAGAIKVGPTLKINSGVLDTYSIDDLVTDLLTSDITTTSNGTPTDVFTIAIPSTGYWEINVIAGYKFQSTTTGMRLITSYSGSGYTMHGKLAATINTDANTEITNSINNYLTVTSVTSSNTEYVIQGKIILYATNTGDFKISMVTITNGSTLTMMARSGAIARKLDNHAP